MKMRMEWFTCRVQFVNDTDPLAYTNGSFPEPTRPPFHCFNANMPLINQLPAVLRLLGAPHQVSFSRVRQQIIPAATPCRRHWLEDKR